MDDSFRNSRDTFPLAAERRIDRICLEFENACQSAAQPQIEQHLGTTLGPERARLLRELLLLELDYRNRAGEQPVAKEYLGRFPEDAGLIEEVFQISFSTCDDPAPGTRVRYFGDYELLERIARGGMGIVYRARQLSLNRFVALKLVLAGQFASEEEVERFHREAEAAANLQHPNIVPIYEVGQHDNQPYFSMAYVEGRSLAEMIRENPLPAVKAARYVQTVARAVEYAHREGTLHRDLKPANILIDRDDQPQITDFGLARRVDADSDLTKSGQILGSPSYMPPEQASGKLGDVGPRSDVYALGAVLYDLVTGRPPFKAETATDTLFHVLHSDPVSLRALNPRVPRDLETICLKCLEKESHRRYPSAAELSKELGRFIRGEPLHARPVSLPGRGWRWCRRNPTVSALAAALIIAMSAGFIGIAFQWFRAEHEAKRAKITAANESVQRLKAEEAAERNRRLLYASDMTVALQAWEAGNVERAIELLDRYLPHPRKEDLRGFQWHHLRWLCQKTRRTPVLAHGTRITGMDFSPDGDTLATIGYGKAVILWDVQACQPRVTIPQSVLVASTAFSPDRSILAWSGGGSVNLWDLSAGRRKAEFPHGGSAICSMAFSPDGMTLAAAGFNREVYVWDVASGKRLWASRRHKLEIWNIAISPDGETLASASLCRVILRDLKSGKIRHVVGEDSGGGMCAAFSPKGKTLAFGDTGGIVQFWDANTGQPQGTMQGRARSPVCSLAYSSDGRLATGAVDGTVTVWDLRTRTELEVLKGHAQTVWVVEFSCDDRTLASASYDGTVRLWDVATVSLPDAIREHAQVTSVAFSPDGSAVVSGTTDGTTSLWDVRTGERLASRRPHKVMIQSVAMSSDGKTVASASLDNRVALMDLNSNEPTHYLEQWLPFSVAFSPDSKVLAVGGAGPRLNFWDIATRTLRYERPGHSQQIRTLAYSPDGRHLASGGWDKEIKLWDVATGDELGTFLGHGGDITCLAFSPDGHVLASGATDNAVILWDVNSGERRDNLTGHTGPVNSVAFTPDGKLLASGSSDRTIRLWYLAAIRQPEILSEREPVTSVAFSPDGSILASNSGNIIRLWRGGADEKPIE